jgi:hypothetical protein
MNKFKVSVAPSSKQEFFIVEEVSNGPRFFPTLVWNRFIVEYVSFNVYYSISILFYNNFLILRILLEIIH